MIGIIVVIVIVLFDILLIANLIQSIRTIQQLSIQNTFLSYGLIKQSFEDVEEETNLRLVPSENNNEE